MLATLLFSLPLLAAASPAGWYERQLQSTTTTSTVVSTLTSGLPAGLSMSAPAASASASSAPIYQFTCPANTSLTYNIATKTYPQFTLAQAVPAFYNWTSAVGDAVFLNHTGSNTTGSTRSLIRMGQTFSETLTSATLNATTGALTQIYTSGYIPNQITNFTIEVTVYSNSSTGVTTIQAFSNSCAFNQTYLLPVYDKFLNGALAGFADLIGNFTLSSQGSSASSAHASASGSAINSALGMSVSAVAMA